VFQNRDSASEARVREPPRIRDPLLPSTARQTLTAKKFRSSAPISFEFQTVLPFIVSPPDLRGSAVPSKDPSQHGDEEKQPAAEEGSGGKV
jgi:hypothetical protein